jgi:hypothetical protein
MNTKNLKVSVVCAWHNRADYLTDTINSLLSQNHPSFEVIVVNDGSTDPRVSEILEGYDDPRLTVIHQANTGFVGAIRRAIESASGQYIAIQGAGDVSLPDRLKKQTEALDADESLCGVACRRYRTTVGGPADGQRTVSAEVPEYIDISYLLANENPINHGDTTFRRSAYERVGGYRSFFKFAQDIDLFIRMARTSRFRILNEILYDRRVFYSDGIANNRPKMVLQRALLEFAKQCEHDYRSNGKDMIEMYGPAGALFNGSSRHKVSKFIAIIAVQYFAIGDHASSDHYSRLAISQSISLTTIASRSMSIIGRQRQIRAGLQSLLRLHPRFSSWNEKN